MTPSEILRASVRETAEALKQRLLSGEKIPLEEISKFLSSASDVTNREKRKLETKPTDVDFF